MTSVDKATLSKFLRAMESIYGPFPASDDPKLAEWTPPATAEGHRGRYLWTDGFAVVNFLTLYKLTEEERYLIFAKRLISTVHNILGYTRDGKSRLPGATDEFPLAGGLRIGKHNETGPDGDGQYFHYLTVWMFALNRVTVVTGDQWYNDQAISMAKSVLPHFMTNTTSERPRMYWKVSMDLSHPLVLSEGNLDPIDGYVTYRLLQTTSGKSEVLHTEVALFEKISKNKVEHYSSSDTLDLGMTLWAAHWFIAEEEWATQLLRRAMKGVQRLVHNKHFEMFHHRRHAFREFGTALGLRCAAAASADGSQEKPSDKDSADPDIEGLPELICTTWEEVGLVPVPNKTQEERLAELMPITAVMYATALIPGLMCRQSLISKGSA